MFDHIQLTALADSQLFGYAKDVPFFQNKPSVAFRPGLNVLFGPNGCGKSTLLKMLGQSMCATQGGVSAVTQGAVHEGVDMMSRLSLRGDAPRSSMPDKLGLAVAHDGQPVVFCDPRQTVGLDGGAFDDDFFREGLEEVTSRGSHGQKAVRRAGAALSILRGDSPFPDKVVRKVRRDHVNDVWQRALDVLEKRFVASIPLGQPTVLLDEPEANFSLQWQARLWELLANPKVAQRFQVIVASHSPFALGIPGAHYIDFVPSFREEVESSLRQRFGLTVTT